MLQFMGEHPILTFFLAVIASNTLVRIIRGHKPRKVKPFVA